MNDEIYVNVTVDVVLEYYRHQTHQCGMWCCWCYRESLYYLRAVHREEGEQHGR
jgi:hypothetical protein